MAVWHSQKKTKPTANKSCVFGIIEMGKKSGWFYELLNSQPNILVSCGSHSTKNWNGWVLQKLPSFLNTETAMSASVCLPAVCLTSILNFFFFNASHCYYFFFWRGSVSVDDSLLKYWFFLFDLASFLQLPLRDLDTLDMAGIQVLSLSVFVTCSELCQSHSVSDLSSARMVAPYSVCLPSASEAAFSKQII